MFLAYHIATGKRISATDANYNQYYGQFKCVVCGEDCLLVKRYSSPYFRHHDGTPDCSLKSSNSIYNYSDFYQALENPKRGQDRELLYNRLKDALEDCVRYDEDRILSGVLLQEIPGSRDINFGDDCHILENCLSSILSRVYCISLIDINISDLYLEHIEQARKEEVNLERQNSIARDISKALIQSSNVDRIFGTREYLASITSWSFRITGIQKEMWVKICQLDHEKIIQALEAYRKRHDDPNIIAVYFLCNRIAEIIYSVNWQKLYIFWQCS